MRKEPNPEYLEVCLDGIGASIGGTYTPPPVPKDISTRKFTVRYIIPTVSSNDALGKKGSLRNMIVTAMTAEDAVRAVVAAHPDADISSVE